MGKVQLQLPFLSLLLYSRQTGPESDQDWAKVTQRGRGRGKPVPRRIPRPPTAPKSRGWSAVGLLAVVGLQPLIIAPGASSLLSQHPHVAIKALGKPLI